MLPDFDESVWMCLLCQLIDSPQMFCGTLIGSCGPQRRRASDLIKETTSTHPERINSEIPHFDFSST